MTLSNFGPERTWDFGCKPQPNKKRQQTHRISREIYIYTYLCVCVCVCSYAIVDVYVYIYIYMLCSEKIKQFWPLAEYALHNETLSKSPRQRVCDVPFMFSKYLKSNPEKHFLVVKGIA